MRRPGRQVTQPGVSLFPFLAVLICTLGVLIVLLVLAVQSANVTATGKQEEAAEQNRNTESQIAKLQSDVEFEKDIAESLKEIRPDVSKRLSQVREYRAHLEREIKDLEKQAGRLAAELVAFEKSESSQPPATPERIEQLELEVSKAELLLAEKRTQIPTVTKKKYSIVPYHGSGSTKRIPIFVECTNDRLILRPWNIELTKADFAFPVLPGNPLDAALLAVRNYFSEFKLVDDGMRPYPLLVVRPSGAQTYGLARRAMSSWDDEFGYELVGAGKDLEFGAVDLQLQQRISEAVEIAKRNQRSIAARRNAQAPPGRIGTATQQPGGGFRASNQHGGFVRENQQTNFQQNQPKSSTQQASQIPSAEFGESVEHASGKQNLKQHKENGSSTVQAIAQQKGANWALPTQTAGAVGYVRPVTLLCDANSIVLQNANGQQERIDLGNNPSTIPSSAIDRLVTIIWARIETWGIAGARAYWKPTLAIKVLGGGESRFEQLGVLLDQSGLGIEKESR